MPLYTRPHRPNAEPVVRRAALFLLVLASCQRRDAPDGRTAVELPGREAWSLATHPSLPVDGDRLAAMTHRALAATGRFAPLPADSPPGGALAARAAVSVVDARVAPVPGGRVEARVRVRLEFRPALADEGSRLVLEADGNSNDSADLAPAAAAEAALRAVLVALVARLDIASHTDEQLVEDLRSPDKARSNAALEQLAGRRHPAAVSPLLAVLRSGDAEVASRALSALVVLDDPRTARAIVEEAERREFPFFLEALYALGAIGGEDSEAYLFTVESGHADVRARTAAGEALEQARVRARSPRRTGEAR